MLVRIDIPVIIKIWRTWTCYLASYTITSERLAVFQLLWAVTKYWLQAPKVPKRKPSTTWKSTYGKIHRYFGWSGAPTSLSAFWIWIMEIEDQKLKERDLSISSCSVCWNRFQWIDTQRARNSYGYHNGWEALESGVINLSFCPFP